MKITKKSNRLILTVCIWMIALTAVWFAACDEDTDDGTPPQKPVINEIVITGATATDGKYPYNATLTLGGNTAVSGNTYAWTSNPDLTFDKTAASPTVSGFTKGATYTFTLKIKNSAGEVEKSKTVEIAANASPTASVTIDSLTPADGKYTVTLSASLSITLNGSASSDPDGGIVTRTWSLKTYAPYGELSDVSKHTFTNGTDGESANVTLKKAGEYIFKLEVKDAESLSDVEEVKVVVEPYQITRNVNVAAVPFVAGAILKFKTDSGDVYSIVGGADALFGMDDLGDITYTFSSVNPTANLSAFSSGNITRSEVNEYAEFDCPTITQTFWYNDQEVGSRKVVADIGTNAFTCLYAYIPTDWGVDGWFDTDFEPITSIPATTLNNLTKDIAEVN